MPRTKGKLKKLRVIPLGGLDEIGKNLTVLEYSDSMLIIDCGLGFPNDDMLGIDLVVPDITYLVSNADKIKGIVLTHGHEDHIGGIPYLLQKLNVPIYGTRLTLGILENKFNEHVFDFKPELHCVQAGDKVKLGLFEVEFVRVNHSIADACALAVKTPVGTVFHSGDFKIDPTPIDGEMTDLTRIGEIGREGVLLFMCESTNVERAGFTPSEKKVGESLVRFFEAYKKKRMIIATFSSNVHRVQQIINTAHKYGRKVVVEGRSMVNIIDTAMNLGCINIPENTLVDIDRLKDYPDDRTVIITTGSQGENMAALSRMASSVHRKVSIGPNDTIIFSSNPIPGNEKAVTRVINELEMKGAEVIFQDVHVSGHACQEEIKLIYTLVHPKYAIPVHGEYKHLKAQAGIAQELGIQKENIFILRSGNVLELNEEKAGVTGQVAAGAILVDGLGIGDVGNVVLRDRQHLAEDGIMIVVVALDSISGQIASGPDLVSRGFVYVKESDALMDEARDLMENVMEGCVSRGCTDWGRIKTAIKDNLGDFIWKKTKRRPMILPIIMEV